MGTQWPRPRGRPGQKRSALRPHRAGLACWGDSSLPPDWNQPLDLPRPPKTAVAGLPSGAATWSHCLGAERRLRQTPGSLLRYIFLVATPFVSPAKAKCPEQAVRDTRGPRGQLHASHVDTGSAGQVGTSVPRSPRGATSAVVRAARSLLLSWGPKSPLLSGPQPLTSTSDHGATDPTVPRPWVFPVL